MTPESVHIDRDVETQCTFALIWVVSLAIWLLLSLSLVWTHTGFLSAQYWTFLLSHDQGQKEDASIVSSSRRRQHEQCRRNLCRFDRKMTVSILCMHDFFSWFVTEFLFFSLYEKRNRSARADYFSSVRSLPTCSMPLLFQTFASLLKENSRRSRMTLVLNDSLCYLWAFYFDHLILDRYRCKRSEYSHAQALSFGMVASTSWSTS